MTAVRLRDLRRHIAELLAQPADPEARAAALDALLARYANRAYRPGAQPDADEPAYHTAAVVLPEVWRGLRHALPAEPTRLLALADALWARGVREPRILAARVLGQAPAIHAPQVFPRFWRWLAVRDRRVRAAVLEHAAQPFVAASDVFLNALQPYLPPQGQGEEAARALWALARLARAEAFDNTPALFRLVRQGLQRPNPELRPDWVPLLQHITRRWPAEAVPLWRHLLWESRDPAGVQWLLRRVLPTAPPEWRPRLEHLLHEARLLTRERDAKPTP